MKTLEFSNPINQNLKHNSVEELCGRIVRREWLESESKNSPKQIAEKSKVETTMKNNSWTSEIVIRNVTLKSQMKGKGKVELQKELEEITAENSQASKGHKPIDWEELRKLQDE